MITSRGSPDAVAATACCEVDDVSTYDTAAVLADSGELNPKSYSPVPPSTNNLDVPAHANELAWLNPGNGDPSDFTSFTVPFHDTRYGTNEPPDVDEYASITRYSTPAASVVTSPRNRLAYSVPTGVIGNCVCVHAPAALRDATTTFSHDDEYVS